MLNRIRARALSVAAWLTLTDASHFLTPTVLYFYTEYFELGTANLLESSQGLRGLDATWGHAHLCNNT